SGPGPRPDEGGSWCRRSGRRRARGGSTPYAAASTGSGTCAVPRAGTLPSAEGVVTGAPRRWLGLKGLVLLAGALIAFGALGQPGWLVPAAILAPDIAMSGSLAGPRPGAHLYNLTHATPLPAVMLGAGYWQANRLVMALVWLAHIGLDRLLGMGLSTTTASPTPTSATVRTPGSQAATARRFPSDRSGSRWESRQAGRGTRASPRHR